MQLIKSANDLLTFFLKEHGFNRDSKKAVPECDGWSDKDERRLMHLTSQPIKVGETALGRHQEVIKQQVDNVITKTSKKERGESNHKFESMEEKEDSREDISVMPDSCTKIPHEAQDEQPLLEQFGSAWF